MGASPSRITISKLCFSICVSGMKAESLYLDCNFQLIRLYFFCLHCVKNVPVRSLFWSVFSRTRAEYGDLLRKSPHKIRTRKNSVFGNFSSSANLRPKFMERLFETYWFLMKFFFWTTIMSRFYVPSSKEWSHHEVAFS